MGLEGHLYNCLLGQPVSCMTELSLLIEYKLSSFMGLPEFQHL